MTEQTKKYFKECGVLVGTIVFFLLVLILTSILSNTAINNGYKNALEASLSENYNGCYNVEDEHFFDVGLYTNFKVFKLKNLTKKQNAVEYAVIVNIPTLYGVLPTFFIYSMENGSIFVDFLTLDKEQESKVFYVSKNSSISFWENRITKLFQVKEGKNER